MGERIQGERGEVLFLAYLRSEGGGLSPRRKKEIHLDLILPEDDELLAEQGLAALRRARILRLCRQAAEQGTVLTYDDLVHLLSTSFSTLKRDVRALEREGLPVPLYRRRGRRPGTRLPLLLFTLLSLSRPGEAQVSSVFGSVSLDYQYEAEESQGTSTSRQAFHHLYNLGVDGKILDPRLATFSLSGTFGSTFLTGEDTRALAFAGSLSLLQGKPYALTLRHSQSFAMNTTETDITSSGANLRLTYPNLPKLFLDFDRLKVETRGKSPSELTFTTGTARFSHRFQKATLEGEFGMQHFEDGIRGTSKDRYFARASHGITLSPATSFRVVADGFSQEDQATIGSSFSLVNRPDPTLSRSVSLGYRVRRSGDQTVHSMDVSGSLSKSFTLFPWLSANASTSASTSGILAGPGGIGLSWSGGGSVVISYLQPVLILADYSLGLSYQEGQEDPFGMTHQVHLGLMSRTLEPFRLFGDYFLTLQEASADSTRHFITLKGEAPLTPNLFLRSFADFLSEASRSPGPPPTSSEQQIMTAGAGASYRPFFNLSLDFSGSLQRTETLTTSTTTLQANTGLSYLVPIFGRPTLSVNGLWERSSQDDRTRFEVRSRLNYLFGQVTLTLEHRFEVRETLGAPAQVNSIFISLIRPFRIGRGGR